MQKFENIVTEFEKKIIKMENINNLPKKLIFTTYRKVRESTKRMLFIFLSLFFNYLNIFLTVISLKKRKVFKMNMKMIF